MSNTRKVWGIKRRLLENDKSEIDLLELEKNSVCSVHHHKSKINRFVLLSGKVLIKTNLGDKQLIINEPFDVEPPLTHQFIVQEDSLMIELAFVNEGKIDNADIVRKIQGGRIVEGVFKTADQLME